MDDTHDSQPDAIEDLLKPPPVPENDPLRQALLARTTQRVRRRRRVKRVALIGAMAACYLAGVMTMRLWMPAAGADEGKKAEKPSSVEKRKAVVPAPEKRPQPPAPAVVSAFELEWQAVDNSERRAELYRRAGDRYLEEDNDVESALRCYRGYLAVAPARDWIISTKDNWVLLVAKQERLKEKENAENGG
jgi:hypothetical protein